MHQVKCTSNSMISQLFIEYIYRMLALLVFMTLLFNSHEALAADPNPFESSPTSALASCPANHKMYYVGTNPPVSTASKPVSSQALNWTAGNANRTFTFTEGSGNKIFSIDFPLILDKNDSEGTVPFYGSINGSTSFALNLVHNSTATVTNHTLNISINRSVSKTGYKIQDVDSLTSSVIIGYQGNGNGNGNGNKNPIYEDRTPYIEQVDVSANSGMLTFNNAFHTANNPAPNTSIVTGIKGRNCSNGECNIDASWGYKAANSPLNLKHNNTLNETSGAHAVGYSDFYFCLAPPKLIVKKALNGNRVNDSDTKRDQFEIIATGGSIATNSFTTTGTEANITNGTSSVLDLAESTSYTITERVMNGTILGDIANYDATYICTNNTTNSTTTMPTAAMTYNQTTQTRSFTLANAAYGDEITCTITNTPRSYTFTGFVFNDNGGITDANATNANITTGPYANNANYFNGVFDTTTPTEAVIFDTLSTVILTDCSETKISTQQVPASGFYSITVSAAQLAGMTTLCIVESRTGTSYPIRTTSDSRNVDFVATKYNYPDNNFGRVIVENAALVLRKAQYVNNCPASINYTASNLNTAGNTNPRTGFSEGSITDNLDPGQCIAYRITATNRANSPITNFVMQDKLQERGQGGALVTSVLANPIANTVDYASDSVPIGQNGVVKTNPFILPSRSNRDFYFNTKYGTTVNP